MNKNEYDQMRNYMDIKYGSAYLSAISKLSVENPYDDNGLLKTEYTLTQKEKDALLFYVKEEKEKTDNSQKQADSPSFGETVKRLVAQRDFDGLVEYLSQFGTPSYVDDKGTFHYNEEKPKTLTPDTSSLERGKALSQALSSDFEAYKEGMQQRRDERYQSMIDELPPIEGPMSRGK